MIAKSQSWLAEERKSPPLYTREYVFCAFKVMYKIFRFSSNLKEIVFFISIKIKKGEPDFFS